MRELSEAELRDYIETPAFRKRAATVRARQDAGENLSIRQIAAALGVPRWFAQASLLQAARQLDGGGGPLQ